MEMIKQEGYDDILSSLDAKPLSDLDHSEPFAVLIMCGKAKEMIGRDPNQHQVKRVREVS